MTAEPGAIYQHYKNGKQYKVLAIAHHTETEEQMVVYQALYDTPDLGPSPVFVRPKEMFEEQVRHNEARVERFTKVS